MTTSPSESPPTRPHSPGLAKNIEARRAIRNRRLAMVLIMAVGIGIIVWDFLRPRPIPTKPAAPEAPAGQPR